MIHQYWVYMVTNKGNTTLYAGVTNDPTAAVRAPHGVSPKSFAWRYQCWKLVYLEEHSDINVAIRRETQIELGSGSGRTRRSRRRTRTGRT